MKNERIPKNKTDKPHKYRLKISLPDLSYKSIYKNKSESSQ